MTSKTRPSAPVKSHPCESFREGEWIIYHCTRCNYQMRENMNSGEIIVQNARADIRHFGTYFPIGFKEAFNNQN